MKEINTPGGTIIAVEWPLNGHAPGSYYCRCTVCERTFYGDKRAVVCQECVINIIGSKVKIIGTITNGEKPVFDFTPEPYVENVHPGTKWEAYFNYDIDNPNKSLKNALSPPRWFETAQDSFLSLLEANGLPYRNAHGKEPELGHYMVWGRKNTEEDASDHTRFVEDKKQWQAAEEKTWKKLVILLKQDKT